MQHILVALQHENHVLSSYSILNFLISLLACPRALDAQGRQPIHPRLHARDWL